MKSLIVAPIFVIFILGFVTQLAGVAESTSTKTLRYTEDMENAMDCAFRGVSISECSPDLMSTDFDEEINETIEISENYLDVLAKLDRKYAVHSEPSDFEIIEEKGRTIIIIKN